MGTEMITGEKRSNVKVKASVFRGTSYSASAEWTKSVLVTSDETVQEAQRKARTVEE